MLLDSRPRWGITSLSSENNQLAHVADEACPRSPDWLNGRSNDQDSRGNCPSTIDLTLSPAPRTNPASLTRIHVNHHFQIFYPRGYL